MSAKPSSRLVVKIDGKTLADEEARAVWERFSAYMEAHQGDVAGFAKEEGVASVQPTYENGKAVLVVKRAS